MRGGVKSKGPVDTKSYSRLLMQLVLLPLLGLVCLAAGLGYSLHSVENSAAWLDHSDRVIARANRLIQLIIDEETGVRGYFLTHDSSFLQPYVRAERLLPEEFQSTFMLVQNNSEQIANLHALQRSHEEWAAITRQDLKNGVPSDMHARKREMDSVRAQAERFLQTEEGVRQKRAVGVNRMNARARDLLIGILVILGLFIAWITVRTFSKLRTMFQFQLEETTRQRDAANAGRTWLNTTIRSIGDAVIACDPKGNVVFMNRVAEQVTGWREADAKDHPLEEVFQIVNESTRAIVESPVDKVLRTGDVEGLANHTVLIRKDGSECAIDDSAAPIRDTNGKMIGIVLVFRDSTERRSSQAALIRAEKLAAAGKLAASIAHEVNNPLEGITNMLYLATESADLSDARQWLVQAQSEVNRLSHITRRTLGFYRESSQPVAFSPAAVMEEVISFYVPEALLKKVELQCQIRSRQRTYGVPGELRQVLSNLIANSLDAMPKGGVIRLTVRDGADLLDETRAGLRITVADTGTGIPAHALQHVFEPFFTTKTDTGTGLGLWVSRELVEKQGGRLRVRTSVSGALMGTVFSIFVPIYVVNDMSAERSVGVGHIVDAMQ